MALRSLLSPPNLRPTAMQLSLVLILAACVRPLWAGEADSSARLKMSDLQAIAGGVFAYAVSPDGSRVVYGADPEISGVASLFSVPVAGGSATILVDSVEGIDRRFLAISSDGAHAVFIRREANGARELFSVPVLGGAEVKLNPPFSSDRSVEAFAMAAPQHQPGA